MNHVEKALLLRQAHQKTPLVLPNVWDAASAWMVEKAGAVAIATTSAGIAWSYGFRDGQYLGRHRMLQALREIADATHLPVTADIESGYGSGSLQDVTETTDAILEAGIVGINLEDTPGRNNSLILNPEEQAERIFAARKTAIAAGKDLFLNARTDVYLAGIGDADGQMDEVVARSKLYLEAGADGIFVPGLGDLKTIGALVRAIAAPLNIMVGPGAPAVSTLGALGVARVSMGPTLHLAALTFIKTAAEEALVTGAYALCENSLSFQEVNDANAHAR